MLNSPRQQPRCQMCNDTGWVYADQRAFFIAGGHPCLCGAIRQNYVKRHYDTTEDRDHAE